MRTSASHAKLPRRGGKSRGDKKQTELEKGFQENQ